MLSLKWLNADMICLVYDITNKESFGHTKFWYEKVKEIFLNNKKVIGKQNCSKKKILKSLLT